jgi:DNA-binding MarR family transcriptional regulator
MVVPIMGTNDDRGSLADALFTPVQQRVLGLLFGQPERRFQSAEIIRLAKSGTGAVHRQLQRLAQAGLVTVTPSGNQKHYQARRDTPVFDELHGLIVKTVGIVEPLRVALQG